MKDALAGVNLLRAKAGRQEGFKVWLPEDTVRHESPVGYKLKNQHGRRRKKERAPKDGTGLETNVWARILSSPIRACWSSGTRLPVALLSNWSLVRAPTSDSIYALPTELADLDAFEEKMAAEMYKEQWKFKAQEWRADAKKRRATSDEVQSTEIVHQDSNVKDISTSPAKSPGRRRRDPFSTRVFTYINYIRHLTASIAKNRTSNSWKDVDKNTPIPFDSGRLFSPKIRETLHTASHYEANRLKVALARKELEKPPHESDKFAFKTSYWQPDIDDRLTRILQKRLVLALRTTVEVLDGSLRKQLERRVLALPIPRTGEFRIQRRRGFSDALRGWRMDRQDGQSSEALDESPASEELIDEPAVNQTLDEETLPPPSWLPGSILLHIGKGNLDELMVPEITPSRALRHLPRLPKNSLIPTMVPVGGAYRIPAFSLHRFFTDSDHPDDIPDSATANLKELEDIINSCASFNLFAPTATRSPPATPTSPLYSPFPGSEQPLPENFFLLIKPFAGAQMNLIEEIWRLWRYMGGHRHGREPSVDDPDFQVDMDLLEEEKEDDPDEDSTPATDLLWTPMPITAAPASSSFGLTMPSSEFKRWLDARYSTANEAVKK